MARKITDVNAAVQCEKTLAALRCPMTEGRRIVRRLTGLLGEIEQRLLERAASTAAA
jgi:hypothetical protein